MKQKLGLACTLIGSPTLLLLDEPTVGVDPLSRRELWEIIVRLVREQNLTVLLSTSYLDEAERCDQVFVLREGKLLTSGRPSEVTDMAAGRTFEAEPASGSAGTKSSGASAGRPHDHRRRSRGGSRAFSPGRARYKQRAGQAGGIIDRTCHRAGASALRRWLHGAVAAASRRRSKIAGRNAVRSASGIRHCRDGHRSERAGSQVRRFHSCRPAQLQCSSRRDLRLARSKRRRQDNDVPHAVRPPSSHCRDLAGGWFRLAQSTRIGPTAHRLRCAEILPLWPALSGGEPRFLRQRLRPARSPQA